MRSCLQNSLDLYWRVESQLVQKFNHRRYVTVISRDIRMYCKRSREKDIPQDPCDSKGYTHTHTPPRGEAKSAKARKDVHVCAQQRQQNEDMTMGTGRDKGVSCCNERGVKCTGTTDVKTWATGNLG